MGACYCNEEKATFLIQDTEGVNKAKRECYYAKNEAEELQKSEGSN